MSDYSRPIYVSYITKSNIIKKACCSQGLKLLLFLEAFSSYEACQFKTITKKTKMLPVSAKGYMAFTEIGSLGYIKYSRVEKKELKIQILPTSKETS